MRENLTRARLQRGLPVFGAWATLSDPAVAEMIGYAGYHFVILDMEHVPNGLMTIERMIRACEISGVTSIVRVPDANPKTILRVLDSGAEGVMVPHVVSATDARDAVAACRYPPVGARGASPTARATRYSFTPFTEYTRHADREVLVVAMVEDREAVGQAPAILATPGLDVVFVAPYDLAGSYGALDRPNDQQVAGAFETFVAASRQDGAAILGMPAGHGMVTRSIAELLGAGVRFIPTAFDVALLAGALRQDVAVWSRRPNS
ncbi:MAG: siderophore biosynthesis protein SbnG [Chloroflexi bacterium]|nr:siderophore biosynthesis protein SbnG [Chloroflexota bacterium]